MTHPKECARKFGLVPGIVGILPDGSARVFSLPNRGVCRAPSGVAPMLDALRRFRPLDVHVAEVVARLCTDRSLLGRLQKYATQEKVTDIIDSLVAAGVLMEHGVAVEHLLTHAQREPQVTPLHEVAIVTKNRPDLLERALRSLTAEIMSSEADWTVTIVDDSDDIAICSETRSRIVRLGECPDIGIELIDRSARAGLCEHLVRVGASDNDIVSFALFGDPDDGFNPGAARNCLSLAVGRKAVLSIDDDVVWNPAPFTMGRQDGLEVSADNDPCLYSAIAETALALEG